MKSQPKKCKRMYDPAAVAAPALKYGDSSLSVEMTETSMEITVNVELPEDCKTSLVKQDLLAAFAIVKEAKSFLDDRSQFFRWELDRRLEAGAEQEAGFLTGSRAVQHRHDWDWKEYAIGLITQRFIAQGRPKAEAAILAKAEAEAAFKASATTPTPIITVK